MAALTLPLLLLLLSMCACHVSAASGYFAITEQYPPERWRQVPASLSFVEYYLPSYFVTRDTALVASFSAMLDQPIFFKASCPRPKSSCKGPALLPCCTDCTSRPAATMRARNCHCPRSDDVICLDTSTPLYRSTFNASAPQAYEIGLGPGAVCGRWAVSTFPSDLLSLEMIASHGFGDYPQPAWLPCAGVGDIYPNFVALRITAVSLEDDEFVVAREVFDFVIVIQEPPPDAPDFLVPMQWFYPLASRLAPPQTLVCDGGVPLNVSIFDCPTMDPALSLWVDSLYGTIPRSPQLVRNDTLTFSLALYTYVYGNVTLSPDLPFNTDVTTCRLALSGLYRPDGSAITDTVSFAPLPPTTCTQENLARYLDASTSLSKLGDLENLVSAALSAVNASNDLNACKSFLLGDLLTAPLTVGQQTVNASLTELCTYSVLDPRFASDPCCNLTLARYVCCAPRTLSAATPLLVSLDNEIAVKCNTPNCVREAVASVLSSDVAAPPELAQCDQALHGALGNFDSYGFGSNVPECPLLALEGRFMSDFAFSTTETIPWLQPCNPHAHANASTCPFGTECAPHPFWVAKTPQSGHVPITQTVCTPSTNATRYYLCTIQRLAPVLRNLLATALGLRTSATDMELVDGVFTGILQDGHVPGMSSYCTWHPDAGRRDCSSNFGSDHYCAAGECDTPGGGPACFEVSRMPGCYSTYRRDANAPGLCKGGIFLRDTATNPSFNCFFPQYETLDACLPALSCPPSRRSSDAYNRTFCDDLCTLPNATSAAQCNCRSSSRPANCRLFTTSWSANYNFCQLIDPNTNAAPSYDDCLGAGGVFFGQRTWQEPFLADQTSCEAAGLCSSDPEGFWSTTEARMATQVYTKSECEALIGCDLPGGYASKAECERHGICSESYKYGKCNVDPLPTSGRLLCPPDTWPFPSVPATQCVGAFPLCEPIPLPVPWPDTPQQCDTSALGCHLPGASVFAPMNASACAACGGAMRPLWFWQRASWGAGHWHGFKWLPRKARDFDQYWLLGLGGVLTTAYHTYVNSLLLQHAACRAGQLNAVLPAVVCDCIERSEGCFNSPAVRSVGAFLGCVNVPTSLNGTGFTYTVVDTGRVYEGLGINVCYTALFSSVARETFALPTDTPYSSFFLASIRPDPYAVVRNNHSVAVGELRSDVIGFAVTGVGNVTLVIGVAQLCITEHRDAHSDRSMRVPCFAAWGGPSAPTLFTPVLFDVAQPSPGVWCANVTQPGYFAYVTLRSDWRTATERDIIPPTSRALFIAAQALYGFLLLLCIARLVGAVRRLSLSREVLLNFASSVVLALFLLLRTVLFGCLTTGALRVSQTVGLFVFAEIGTMLELTVGALTVYLWLSLYHRTMPDPTQQQPKKLDVSVFAAAVFVCVAIAVYAFFIGVCIGLAHAVGHSSTNSTQLQAVCARPSGLSPAEVIDRLYKTAISILAFVLAILVAVYGSLHVRRMGYILDRFPLWQLEIVTAVTFIGLILQAVLVLYIAFAPGNTAVVVCGALAELLRPAAIVVVLGSLGWRAILCCEDYATVSQSKAVNNIAEGGAEQYVIMNEDDRSEL